METSFAFEAVSSSKKTSKVEAASAETSTLQSASGCDVNSTYQDLVHRVLQSGAVQQREERASFSASSRSSSCRTLADSIVKDLEHSKDTNSDSFADPHALTSWLAQAGHLSEKEELDRRLSYQTPSTALWLTDTKAYHSWHDSLGPATLFIEGLAGTGKSVLVASMIAHLHKKEPDAVVLYFFFRPGSSKQSPMSLTMSWLVALLLHSAYCQEEFRRFIQRQPSDLTDEALWEFVLASLLSHPTVYCIVDGLDQVELPHTNTITTRLHHIATLRPKSIKVLATSRTREEIRRSTLATSALQLDIEERMRSDIKHLIDYRLRTALPDHDLVEVRNAIARDIFTALPVHAGGPFQYARSLIDSLTGVKPLVDLEKPPHSVEDVYNVMQRLQLHANPSPDKRLLLSLESLQKWTAFTGSHRTNVEVPRADRLLQLQLKPGQTRFQMRDARGVRHQLIRLFIDRGYHRAAPPSKYPLMHALFERVCCAVSCLEVFFEYGDNVNFNLRDPHGRTVLHAACNARVLKAAYLLAGNAHVPRKDVWFHGTSFFLKMPAYKADVFAVDNGGRTALHILLNNPSMCEDHILTFLDRHGSTDLVCRRDKHGMRAIHYALRVLRPRTCRALISHGADIAEADPDGNTALHHIAQQCLHWQLDVRGTIKHTSFKTGLEYTKACLGLWRKCLSLGISLNSLDSNALPPLYRFITSKCERGEVPCNDAGTDAFELETGDHSCMHLQYIYAFFAGASWSSRQHATLQKHFDTWQDQRISHTTELLEYITEWFKEKNV